MHSRSVPKFCLTLFVLAQLAAFTTGCGQTASGPPLTEVKGKVTLDGQPLPNARVVFVPDAGPASAGVTNADGDYELLGKTGEKGAVSGKHTVEISTDLDGTRDPAKEKVPAQFNTQTTLTVDVVTGPNTHNFELQSK